MGLKSPASSQYVLSIVSYQVHMYVALIFIFRILIFTLNHLILTVNPNIYCSCEDTVHKTIVLKWA